MIACPCDDTALSIGPSKGVIESITMMRIRAPDGEFVCEMNVSREKVGRWEAVNKQQELKEGPRAGHVRLRCRIQERSVAFATQWIHPRKDRQHWLGNSGRR